MIFQDDKLRESIRTIFTGPPDPKDAKSLHQMCAGYLPPLFETAAMLWGDSIARATCDLYGKADSADAVTPEHSSLCFQQFVRLTDPWLLEPRPAAKLAPYQAANALDARVARLEYAEAERRRAKKADALRRKLWNAVVPFEGISVYYDLHIPNVPPDLDDLLATGLMRMTVGNWRNPCPRGLKELESLLRLPMGGKGLRQLAKQSRADKAASWKLFEKFARDQMRATEDAKRYEQMQAALRVADSERNVYPYHADFVFEDQRYRPEGMSLEGFDRLRRSYDALLKGWYAFNRAAAIKAEAAKLTDFRNTEFG